MVSFGRQCQRAVVPTVPSIVPILVFRLDSCVYGVASRIVTYSNRGAPAEELGSGDMHTTSVQTSPSHLSIEQNTR